MPAPRTSAAAQPSWLDALQALLQELPGLLSDRVELLSLELHRAGLALGQIVALIVAAAILGTTAWLALCGCAVGLLMVTGLHWAVALLLVLLVNAAGCAVALVRVMSLAPLLALPATRRHLTLRVTPETASESALHETSGELNYRATTTP